jgi:hypothetical protein
LTIAWINRRQIALDTGVPRPATNSCPIDVERRRPCRRQAQVCCGGTGTTVPILLAAARDASADIVLIGGVHKMSRLVQWAKIEAIDDKGRAIKAREIFSQILHYELRFDWQCRALAVMS